MKVQVFVTPKQGILDPQGRAIEQSLASLGFSGVQRARMGKFIELEINAASAEAAREQVRGMCEQLLANTVIEDYRIEVPSSLR